MGVSADFQEMLWGGNTYVRWGTKFDKHGNERLNSEFAPRFF